MIFNKKILVLGNETSDTDLKVSDLASRENTVNHGLLTNVPTNIDIGYYHTTVSDMIPGEIVRAAEKFDTIIMLNQSKESYPHYKSFVTTVRLMYDLESRGLNVEYRNNESSKNLIYWRDLLQKNKSFCFYPFLAHVETDRGTAVCTKNFTPVSKNTDTINWQTNPDYVKIRQNMLEGKLNLDHCYDCYDREKLGLETARQYETLEWAERLSAESMEDFAKIKTPLYYEIWLNNMCNIMCRTCDDGHSHLIEKEWKSIGVPLSPWKLVSTQHDKIDLNSVLKVYWGGGEPTIMIEFHNFLQKCIDNNHTDFELSIGTNGMKFSNKLISLLDNFSNVNLSFSFDGYDKVNDYIRWKSNFNTIVENSRIMRDRGHKISLQTVFSMWSISRMHELFEFYDQEFPDSGLLVQVGGSVDKIFMPYNHPRPDLIVESMRRCQQTDKYYMNGRSIKSMIDSLLDYYSDPNYKVDVDLLRKFYEFNDKMDRARGTKLGDYIPELEQGRKLCQ